MIHKMLRTLYSHPQCILSSNTQLLWTFASVANFSFKPSCFIHPKHTPKTEIYTGSATHL